MHVSTDEVYGSVEHGPQLETDPLDPRSPYSASKAGSDLIARSYYSTYGLPVVDHPLVQQLRPVAVPREGDPARSSPTCSTAARCRCTATGSTGGTGSTWRTTAPPSTWCCARATPGEIYNIGGRQRADQPGPHRAAAAPWPAPGRRWIEYVDGPSRPRPALRGRLVQGPGPRLGTAAARSTRPSKPRSPGTGTTGGGGSRSRRRPGPPA